MKRIVSSLMVVAALLGLMMVPASAAELTGSVATTWYYGASAPVTSKTLTVDFPLSLGDEYSSSTNQSGGITLSVSELDTGAGNLGGAGSVGFYYSFYFYYPGYQAVTYSTMASGFDSSTWLGYWYDQDGVQHSMDSLSVSSSSSLDYLSSSVYRLSSNVSLDDSFSLSRLHFMRPAYDSNYIYTDVMSGRLVVSSCSVVSTELASDLVALEGIATEIADTNAILNALYGDIMSMLSSMYSQLGDLETVQQVANNYLSQIVTSVQGIEADSSSILELLQLYIHNLESIATTSSDILTELEDFHTSFRAKLDLLMSNLSIEFNNTRDTIYAAIDILIQYLDTNFKDAISDGFEEANSSLDGGISQNHGIEQEWTGSLATDWQALDLDSYSFDDSYTNAFMVLSLWFSNIFNGFGSFSSVIIFPSLVGICMLLIGVFRMGFSRSYSSRGSDRSKGGSG